jgi:hypothetical protein
MANDVIEPNKVANNRTLLKECVRVRSAEHPRTRRNMFEMFGSETSAEAVAHTTIFTSPTVGHAICYREVSWQTTEELKTKYSAISNDSY